MICRKSQYILLKRRVDYIGFFLFIQVLLPGLMTFSFYGSIYEKDDCDHDLAKPEES